MFWLAYRAAGIHWAAKSGAAAAVVSVARAVWPRRGRGLRGGPEQSARAADCPRDPRELSGLSYPCVVFHGTALGAGSDVIALSVAAGLTKSVLVMIGTPFVAGRIGLNNPHSALIYGGLMGTTSGVAGGLAATDPKLVPYGAMTAPFSPGMGCLLAPSLLYLMVRAIV